MLTKTKLLLRNLRHFRGANLAVIAGAAVATAVLAGALLVGDSVRASLTELANRRLEWVDHVMVTPRMVSMAPVERRSHGGKSESLVDALRADPEFAARFEFVTPGVLVRGSVAVEDARPPVKAAGVQMIALRDKYPSAKDSAWLNPALAKSLKLGGLKAGQPAPAALRFTIPAPDETPKDSALAKRGRNETITSMSAGNAVVAERDSFRDLFDLAGGQRSGATAWLSYPDLQETWDAGEQANLFLVQAKAGHTTAADAEALNAIIRKVAEPADYALELVPSSDKSQVALTSRSTYVPPRVVDAAEALAKERGVALQKVSVYLVNKVVSVAPPAGASAAKAPRPQIHYAIAAGIDRIDGKALRDDQVVLNRWTAEQLGVAKGAKLRLDYYLRQSTGELAEVRSDRDGVGLTFEVADVIEMTGLGADPSLTPTYKGLSDAESFSDWRPPQGLNIDKKLVTKDDDAYWGKYKGSPKLFVSLNTARKLWGTEAPGQNPAFGDVTSLRLPTDKAKEFVDELVRRIDPASAGLAFRAVRADQLSAAAGGTDFSELFGAFSFFLLAAAVMLVAMLFRLSVEQRSRQLGLLAAAGFSSGQLRGLCLREGLLLAVIGAIVGLIGAVGYTALIVHGLRTWWVGAIGTTALRLHVNPVTLVIGFAGAVVVALLAIVWATRRVSKVNPSALLAGALGAPAARLAGRPTTSLLIAVIAFLGAVALFAAGALRALGPAAAYLGGGSLLLIAALAITFARLRPDSRSTDHPTAPSLSLASLSARNATRNRARSLLCVALIALASFALVTVSSMQSGTPADTHDPKSGAGGYTLIVKTDIPLLADLGTLEGRKLLMRQEAAADPRWAKAKFAMLRTWTGQDVSCLNITRPDSPTVLAIPPAMGAQNRFTFASTETDVANPWGLLVQPQPDGAIPVLLDDETAKYIMKVKLGQTIPLTDSLGRAQKLKLVATLAGSVFQSEMLMGEANFLRLFPAQAGYSTVMVEAAPADVPAVTDLLNETLNDVGELEKTDYSATIQTTAARLAAYHEVANTYISTFRALGALGLMLGTVGLAVVMVRNLFERRAELTLLSVLGFDPARRAKLVLLENAGLLVLGLAVGTVCALAGVIPNVMTSAHVVNVREVVVSLGLVLGVGLASLLVATAVFARRVTPGALRAE
ncbi:MAG TPA: FtsX-like permease family protein [Tepidisphaeraceae bacterium]|nr:FtsX-like permease family protein [Tepidisphaeraceae bacterium]